jgi:hypothetical protein
MNINALLEIKTERTKYVEKEYIPIKVVCIVSDLSNFNDIVLKNIRDYCNGSYITFSTRIYNSFSYSEDMNFIERLPAFHIYFNNCYIKTFYPNTRPIQHIEESVNEWKMKKEKRRLAREKWITRLKEFFKLFIPTRRKSLMEKIQENERERKVNATNLRIDRLKNEKNVNPLTIMRS